MPEHTNAPWTVFDDDGVMRVRNRDGELVLDQLSQEHARLIAASPDLLHAASLVLRDLYDKDILLEDDTERALISAVNKVKE